MPCLPPFGYHLFLSIAHIASTRAPARLHAQGLAIFKTCVMCMCKRVAYGDQAIPHVTNVYTCIARLSWAILEKWMNESFIKKAVYCLGGEKCETTQQHTGSRSIHNGYARG